MKFANLIAAGLASSHTSHMQTSPNYSHHYGVKLTEKGKMVIEAWKAGDKDALDRALAQGAGPKGGNTE